MKTITTRSTLFTTALVVAGVASCHAGTAVWSARTPHLNATEAGCIMTANGTCPSMHREAAGWQSLPVQFADGFSWFTFVLIGFALVYRALEYQSNLGRLVDRTLPSKSRDAALFYLTTVTAYAIAFVAQVPVLVSMVAYLANDSHEISVTSPAQLGSVSFGVSLTMASLAYEICHNRELRWAKMISLSAVYLLGMNAFWQNGGVELVVVYSVARAMEMPTYLSAFYQATNKTDSLGVSTLARIDWWASASARALFVLAARRSFPVDALMSSENPLALVLCLTTMACEATVLLEDFIRLGKGTMSALSASERMGKAL